MNLNFKLIFAILGYIITLIGALMLIPATIDFFTQGGDPSAFFIFSLITSFIGLTLAFSSNQDTSIHLTNKDSILLTVLSWIVIVSFAALPLKFSYLNMSYTDAFFEIMSGITTTGSTIITDLEVLSYGFHFWRALMQWIGGIGIIVTAVILVPSLQGGGMQAFRSESFETFDNVLNKAKEIAYGIIIIYVILTILILLALIFIAKLNFFDSLIHSLTSISTAGFSNKNESIAYFNNPKAEIILMISMVLGGIPYILIYYFLFLRKAYIFKDIQVKGYFFIIITIIVGLTFWLVLTNGFKTLEGLRIASFSTITLLTGTGFVSYDYSTLGMLPTMVLFFTMFIGGCAGSTACGIKIYRLQTAYSIVKSSIKKFFLNQHIFTPYYNQKVIPNNILMSLFSYFILLFFFIMIGSIILTSMELDFITSITVVVTCIMNVGPAFGNIAGPTGNFASIPDLGKWLLSFLMLVGRLEIMLVLAVVSPLFWKD